jgi:hypothetical protein
VHSNSIGIVGKKAPSHYFTKRTNKLPTRILTAVAANRKRQHSSREHYQNRIIAFQNEILMSSKKLFCPIEIYFFRKYSIFSKRKQDSSGSTPKNNKFKGYWL